MIRQEFVLEFHSILNVYGDKNYPPVRVELIYEYLKALSREEFKSGLNTIIGNEKHPPMMNEFREYFKNIIQTKNKNLMEEMEKENHCVKCNSTGMVLIKQKYGMADNAYQCNCYLGKKFYSHFPKIFTPKQINKD